ncbi:MAG: DNA recombination protein RmuC [Ilumatobacteraceae bacterium]|nr:DNA recombination protein RmuC [Ilumatobacteraceae bacterium]
MVHMNVVTILLGVSAAGLLAAVVYLATARRADAHRAETRDLDQLAMQGAVDQAVQAAIAEAREQAVSERDAAIAAALEQSAVLQREQLGATTAQARDQASAELTAKKDVIDARLDQVHEEMRSELTRLGELVSSIGKSSAESFGQVSTSLQAHAEVANALADSTHALKEALAHPQTRGQWGERIADDVLRLAGFQENVNYTRQATISGGSGRPDYTFPMPKGHELYMDVKFPMASYLRYLEARTDAEREAHLKRFLGDVRLRVRELAKREYPAESAGKSVDYVLLFLPNEQLTGFIHEHDPGLLDDALRQNVVMCSPLTLFAFLGVIRQAFDNFMIEQTSDEILKLLGQFGVQWRKYVGQVDTVKKRFESVDKALDQLAGTRRRQLEKPLVQLEALRLQKGLPVDGELFALDDTPSDGIDASDDEATIRSLGA